MPLTLGWEELDGLGLRDSGDANGTPILSSGSFRIDQTSPIERRWGGWYVTGTHGKMKHLGNLVVEDHRPPEQIENRAGLNLANLMGHCDTSAYLTRHSDIAALMVLEHQTEMHNLITRANFQTRLALHDEAVLNKEIGRAANYRSETTTRRIKSACHALVKYMLCSGEARLADTVQGTSALAREFFSAARATARGGRCATSTCTRGFSNTRAVISFIRLPSMRCPAKQKSTPCGACSTRSTARHTAGTSTT